MDVVLASGRSDLRFALEVFLREQRGVVVVGTATGVRGLMALIESTCPDVVILDWGLPGLPRAGQLRDGKPLAGVLAAARTCEPPPSIIVMGRDELDREAALQAGADIFLQHGDPPEALLVDLRHIRARRDAPVEPIPTNAEGE